MLKTLTARNIYLELLELIRAKNTCVLTTVTKTEGSTPQKPGCSAIFGQKQLLAGTIGGGVVELKIQKMAIHAFDTQQSGYYSFNLDNDISNNSEAICGGGMDILLDAHPEKHKDIFEEIKSSCLNRIPGVLITCFNKTKSANRSIKRLWITKKNLSLISSNLNPEIRRSVTNMLNNPIQDNFKAIVLHSAKRKEKILAFFETIVPSPRLIIAGAGHVGKALAHLGNLLDFHVTIWDDRREFANKENLPDAHEILSGSLNDNLEKIIIDHATYLVIVTRGHINDAEVLKAFIKSPAAYIGMIGSRKKIGQMRKKFLNENWVTPEQWDKIYSPIGIDIQSKTVQEIALSITAQLVLVRNQNNRKYE